MTDSRLGSVNSAVVQQKRALYNLILVETVHCDFPRLLLGETYIEGGRWVACSTVKDEIKLHAFQFKYLKVKDFILTCSTYAP